jgi:hypothetical protein
MILELKYVARVIIRAKLVLPGTQQLNALYVRLHGIEMVQIQVNVIATPVIKKFKKRLN